MVMTTKLLHCRLPPDFRFLAVYGTMRGWAEPTIPPSSMTGTPNSLQFALLTAAILDSATASTTTISRPSPTHQCADESLAWDAIGLLYAIGHAAMVAVLGLR